MKMSSRVAAQEKLVIFHTEDTQKEKQIAALCGENGIRTRQILPGDLNKTVGTLAGIKSNGPVVKGEAAAPALPGTPVPEMMIFCGFQSEALDEFLKKYREHGIAPIGLKAIVTPYNYNWSIYQLSRELMQERLAMLASKKD
jgi:hypothetical protein